MEEKVLRNAANGKAFMAPYLIIPRERTLKEVTETKNFSSEGLDKISGFKKVVCLCYNGTIYTEESVRGDCSSSKNCWGHI